MVFGLFKKDAKLNNPVAVEIEYGGETLRLETGRMAKQANGSVLATMGGTMVLATVCAEKTAVEGQDFFPLTVDYQEKFASAGRIPGSRDRREGKSSTGETLIARLIDRPIRPLFPETFKNKVQIIAQVFSYDKKNQPDILAMIASSAALALSGVPFQGPIGAARVSYADGEYILNPSRKFAENSEMDLVVAATKDGVLMVESCQPNIALNGKSTAKQAFREPGSLAVSPGRGAAGKCVRERICEKANNESGTAAKTASCASVA